MLALRMLAACLLPATAVAGNLPQATADYEVLVGGKSMLRGKLYISGERFRSETGSGAIIVDARSKRMWTMIFRPPLCEVQPLADVLRRGFPWLPANGAKERRVGSETIDGHPTKKYRTTTGLKDETRYVWRASDLEGLPIRITDEERAVERKLTNVVLGRPDPSLFRPPPGCRSGKLSGTPPGSISP